jgi:uncharacterized protein
MINIDQVEQNYAARLHEWQLRMEAGLRAEDGWLTVVGLDWLEAGDNTVGSAPTSDVTLPNAAVPAEVGVLRLENGRVTLHVTTDEPVLVNGQPAKTAMLNDDHSDLLTNVQIASVTFFIIKRGDQYAVRIRDTQSHARQTFRGRAWFPADESYRVVGRFIPHASNQTIQVESANGPDTILENPGRVEFELHGQHLSLEAADGGKGQLWFIFRDATSGVSTYSASRFLKAPFTEDGTVDLDFNKAYHPPCAFTDYATCPLPPRENRLTITIEAGEKLPE